MHEELFDLLGWSLFEFVKEAEFSVVNELEDEVDNLEELGEE